MGPLFIVRTRYISGHWDCMFPSQRGVVPIPPNVTTLHNIDWWIPWSSQASIDVFWGYQLVELSVGRCKCTHGGGWTTKRKTYDEFQEFFSFPLIFFLRHPEMLSQHFWKLKYNRESPNIIFQISYNEIPDRPLHNSTKNVSKSDEPRVLCS